MYKDRKTYILKLIHYLKRCVKVMKKKYAAMFILSILMFSLVASFVFAGSALPSSSGGGSSAVDDKGIWDIFTGVLNKIAEIGSLQFKNQ